MCCCANVSKVGIAATIASSRFSASGSPPDFAKARLSSALRQSFSKRNNWVSAESQIGAPSANNEPLHPGFCTTRPKS